MPAETHQHGTTVTAADIIDLLAVCVPGQDDLLADPSTPLHRVGLDDELLVLDVWDTSVEEFAERGIGEPDLSELLEATTVGELVEATVRCLRDDGGQT